MAENPEKSGKGDAKNFIASAVFRKLDLVMGFCESASVITKLPVPRLLEENGETTHSRFKNAASFKSEGGGGLVGSSAGPPASSSSSLRLGTRKQSAIRPRLIELPIKGQSPVQQIAEVAQVVFPDGGGVRHFNSHDERSGQNDSPMEQYWEEGQYELEDGEVAETDEEEVDYGEEPEDSMEVGSEEEEEGTANSEGEYEPEEGELLDSDEANEEEFERASKQRGVEDVKEVLGESCEAQFEDEDINKDDDGRKEADFPSESEPSSGETIMDTSSSEEEDEQGLNELFTESSSNEEEDEGICKDASTWFQINLDKLGGIQMGVVEDAMLWSCSLKPEGYNDQLEEERHFQGQQQQQQQCHQGDVGIGLVQFYVVFADGSSDFQLKVVASQVIKGTKILKAEVVEFFVNKRNKKRRYLVMLTNSNELFAFDIQQKTVESFLELAVSDPDKGTFFNDLVIFYDTGPILLLLEQRSDGDMQSITVFNYPPNWESVYVFTFDDNLSLELSIAKNEMFLVFELFIELTVLSWTSLTDNASLVLPTKRRPINSSVSISNEWQISEIPKPDEAKRFNLITPNAHLLAFEPSLLVIDSEYGKEFHELDHFLEDASQSAPIYDLIGEDDGQLGDGYTKVIVFPDGSSRILNINKQSNVYEVVSFEQLQDGTIGTSVSFPFDEYAVSRYYSSHLEKKRVLGIAFSDRLNLLCVLFSHMDRFDMNFYEPNKLTLVQSLPIVKRVTSKKYRNEQISDVFIYFGSTLLLVQFTFDLTSENEDEDDDNADEAKTFDEVYWYPLIKNAITK